VSVQATQRTLSEHAPDPEAYAAKYAELKAKNVRELDRFLMVAAKVLTGACDTALPSRLSPRTPGGDHALGGDAMRRCKRGVRRWVAGRSAWAAQRCAFGCALR
jgi:hypothetical protein